LIHSATRERTLTFLTSGARRASNALIDRIQPSRGHLPPPRAYPHRDDFGPPGGRYPPRDMRYGYDHPPPGRDSRRPPSPRDYRDYPAGPPPPMRRDYDDYRMRGPPPTLPPPHTYDRPTYYPADDGPPGYPPRGYGPPPPPRDPYDRYDRRPLPPNDRYAAHPPGPPITRPRSPLGGGPPPRGRDDFDRLPPRYVPQLVLSERMKLSIAWCSDYPPPIDSRGRPLTPPPRYADPLPRIGSTDPLGQRYR
jgi:hypothetical protein